MQIKKTSYLSFHTITQFVFLINIYILDYKTKINLYKSTSFNYSFLSLISLFSSFFLFSSSNFNIVCLLLFKFSKRKSNFGKALTNKL